MGSTKFSTYKYTGFVNFASINKDKEHKQEGVYQHSKATIYFALEKDGTDSDRWRISFYKNEDNQDKAHISIPYVDHQRLDANTVLNRNDMDNFLNCLKNIGNLTKLS